MGLSQLRELCLSNTEVSDAGLDNLTGLHELERLWVIGTKVTGAGEKKVKQTLPNCSVVNVFVWP